MLSSGMADSGREVEIKLRFDTAEAATACIESAGCARIRERRFEDNVLYETPERTLKPAGKMLRLRVWGDQNLVTFKARVPGEHLHKVREEVETLVDNADAMRRIFAEAGLQSVYRYQKYRTLYDKDGTHVCLDETPLGCFVEIEGEPDAIDSLARMMGFGTSDYIQATYRDLHEAWADDMGQDPGDLLFEDDEAQD